jgi:hypothetical protein
LLLNDTIRTASLEGAKHKNTSNTSPKRNSKADFWDTWKLMKTDKKGAIVFNTWHGYIEASISYTWQGNSKADNGIIII